MKKFLAFFTAMVLTIVSFAADVTVYFHNTEGWTSVYAYAWSPQNAAWPGEKMSPTNMENYFAYVLTGDQKNIIFTNGTGTQTQNLTVEAGRCFEWVNGTTTTSWTDAPEGIQIGESGPTVTETIDVTVRVYTEEAAPKIWWWGGGIAGSDATYEWDARPSMNKEGETNWYAWTFEGVNKDLGISYKITATGEREFTNVKENNCYDANLDLLDCNYTPSAQDTTITNPTDTTIIDPNMPTEGFGILIYGEEGNTGIAGVLNEAQKDWTEYAITGVELEAGAQFQIYDFTHKGGWVEKLDAASTEHVTAGEYWYIVDAKGTYDIYLKMFGYNDNQVYIGYTAPTTTDIEAIQSSNTAAKVMIDGHIYIIRGGKVFNINGQLMK